MARVTVLVAHPDDEVLGVGGTILRHLADGDTVRVHIECMTTLRDQARRTADARKVAGMLGYELTLGDSDQLGYRVPDFGNLDGIVYTHWPHDLNRDHRLVSEGAQVAARYATSLRYFETLSSTEWGTEPFRPNLYVGVDMPAKLAALTPYGSELRDPPHPRSLRAVVALAEMRGSTAGLLNAEAFHVAREVR